jgi:hypothetical protein
MQQPFNGGHVMGLWFAWKKQEPDRVKETVATSLQLHSGEGKWAALIMPNPLMVCWFLVWCDIEDI